MKHAFDFLFALGRAVSYSPAKDEADRAKTVAHLEERNLEQTRTKLAEQRERLSIPEAFAEVTREIDRSYDSNLF
jgi:hypothetical protein